MKKGILLAAYIGIGLILNAQDRLFIHQDGGMTVGVPIVLTDSLYFSEDGSFLYMRVGDTLAGYEIERIDSLSFGTNPDTVYIRFDGKGVSVVNPMAFEGVGIEVNGGDVRVTALPGETEVKYVLQGTSTDGQFKINSEKRFHLIMNGLTLTNSDGPAISIQSEKRPRSSFRRVRTTS